MEQCQYAEVRRVYFLQGFQLFVCNSAILLEFIYIQKIVQYWGIYSSTLIFSIVYIAQDDHVNQLFFGFWISFSSLDS